MAALLVVAAYLAPTIAGADERTLEDADDSASAIDIRAVKQGHYSDYVLYRIAAYERWDPIDLEGGRIVVHFNLDADPAIERRGIVEYVGGGGSEMRSTVVNRNGTRVGRAVHRRPSERSIELWFKRWQLKRAMRHHAFVTVETTDDAGCAEACVDRAPDSGTLFHRLMKLCSRLEPTISGTSGDDTLHGTRRADVIAGLGGNDEIVGVKGNDVVCGGPGNDVIEGGTGFLLLRGGKGADRIIAIGPRPQPCDDTGRGSASCAYPQAIVVGGAGADVLTGGRRHEWLIGGRGHDTLRGGRWSDGLDGGAGQDEGWGGRGQDACSRLEDQHTCEG